MALGANGAADLACREWARSRDGLWHDTGTLHSFDRNMMLGAVPAVAAHEDAGILATSILAAANNPLLLKLTLGAWVIWPFKLFHHFGK
jgi:hypothetical protein